MDWGSIASDLKELIIKYDLLIIGAGIVSTYVTQWIKCAIAWKRKAATILSIVIAFGFAILAGWIDGTIKTWADIVINLVQTFTVAQLWYNFIVYKKSIK